jgi:hypothetical protein
VSQGTWAALTGKSSIISFYGFGDVGTHLQFGDTGSDQIYRASKATADTLSIYAAQADIMAATGGTSVQLLASSAVSGTEQVFYEGSTDQILMTAGANTVNVLVDTAALQNAQGNTSVSGLGPAANGDLYWGNNTSDDMFMRKADGTITQVLTTTDITSVTSGTTAGFRDVLAAPDGYVYFYETGADSILRFDPAAAATTLEIFLSEQQLLDGPAGSDGVYELEWYVSGADSVGVLGFNIFQTHGFYIVPEPAGLCLLALGGLAVLRRRR